MGIPLSLFLILYLIVSGIFLLYALFNLYHIFRYGHFDAASYFMTGFFIAGFILIVFVSFVFINQIDWQHSIQLLKFNGSFNEIPTTQF